MGARFHVAVFGYARPLCITYARSSAYGYARVFRVGVEAVHRRTGITSCEHVRMRIERIRNEPSVIENTKGVPDLVHMGPNCIHSGTF